MYRNTLNNYSVLKNNFLKIFQELRTHPEFNTFNQEDQTKIANHLRNISGYVCDCERNKSYRDFMRHCNKKLNVHEGDVESITRQIRKECGSKSCPKTFVCPLKECEGKPAMISSEFDKHVNDHLESFRKTEDITILKEFVTYLETHKTRLAKPAAPHAKKKKKV